MLLLTFTGITIWQLLYSSSVYSCSIGLTQLRYRSLSLMFCTPPTNSNEQDPCPTMLNGRSALCQYDEAEGRYVCCGTPELLVSLLSPTKSTQNFQLQSDVCNQSSGSLLERLQYSGVTSPSHSTANGFLPLYSYSQTTPLYLNYGHQLQPLPFSSASTGPATAPTIAEFSPSVSNYRQIVPLKPANIAANDPINSNLNYTLLLGPALSPFLASFFTNNNSVSSYSDHRYSFDVRADFTIPKATEKPLTVTLTNATHVFSNIVKGVKSDGGPILSLMTDAYYIPGNVSHTWTATSTVVLLQDGPCSIIVNTGLPIQRNQIIASLAAKGIVGNKLDYTVITSGFPQFIGNANLFPTSQFIVGQLYAHWTTLALSTISATLYTDLCSPKTQIMHTPGPSPDSVTVIARNVPSMGTVAIAGALFIQDIDISRLDTAFVWNKEALIESRRKVICISDWIIPGHSKPTAVTVIHKQQANCSDS